MAEPNATAMPTAAVHDRISRRLDWFRRYLRRRSVIEYIMNVNQPSFPSIDHHLKSIHYSTHLIIINHINQPAFTWIDSIPVTP